jgi:hypothetical protein
VGGYLVLGEDADADAGAADDGALDGLDLLI